MTRGTCLYLLRSQVRDRALAMTVAVLQPPRAGEQPRPISYRNDDSGQSGGDNPNAPHCADWSYGQRTPTADCIGFALWASGIDRLQPGYRGSRKEWLNCASLLDDADGAKHYCRPLATGELAMVGDWLLTDDHIGVIVRPATRWTVGTEELTQPRLIVDCSPRHGYLNSIQVGQAWSPGCRVIRPLIYGPRT